MNTLSTPVGRLVIVLEKRLTSASRKALRDLLATLMQHPDVTFVAGLGKAAMISAGHMGQRVFYNTNEHIPLGDVAPLVPWREIWLISAGRVWRTSPEAGRLPFYWKTGGTSNVGDNASEGDATPCWAGMMAADALVSATATVASAPGPCSSGSAVSG